MATITTHPTNNPNLPSYLGPDYLAAEASLKLVQNVWDDLQDVEKAYLPQEDSEPDRAYTNRLKRTKFDNRFSPALKGHAGLLSEFSLTDETAESIKAAIDDVDLQGSSLTTFLTEVDEMALRDGGVGLLVEYPQAPTDEDGNPLEELTTAQQAEFGHRPYLVAVDRRDILNWDIQYRQGKPIITRLVIRQATVVPVGDYGCKLQLLYRVLRPGTFEVYEIIQSAGQFRANLIPELSGTTSLDEVPFVWYSVSQSKILKSKLPFLNLARLNVEHYQKRSSLNEVLHKCNMPVPVRRGLIKSVADLAKLVVRLVIGPNSVVDVPSDGDFFFAEPTGNAIAATQADIEKLEGAMDRVSLAFLTGGEAAKTATEVVMDSSQTQCSLKGMARRKESAIQQVFKIWGDYTGEEKTGGIKVNESVLQVPAPPQEIQVILDAMGVKIPNEIGLKMLQQRKWLPADADLKEINKQLEGEQDRQEALATAAAIQAEANNNQPANQPIANNQPNQPVAA